MAQRGTRLNRERFCCPICLDLLKVPVTVSCGHSYCFTCIRGHWETEDEKGIFSCPQCRKTFISKPELEKNIMLADLVEELKKIGVQSAPADHYYAGAEDVACDVCTGRKMKALKSCLVCLASYCEEHLQPHYQSPPFKKHKLVEPSKNLQENICSHHDKVSEMYKHKGCNVVSAAAERKQKQRELELNRETIQQSVQERKKYLEVLQQQVNTQNLTADTSTVDCDESLADMISLLEERRSDVKQQIRSQHQREVRGLLKLQEKLLQEVAELKRADTELKKLSLTQDDDQFLLNWASLSELRPPTHMVSINVRRLRCFEDITEAVSHLRASLQDLLTETWTNISETPTLLRPEPETRAWFLQYSQEITLDPNTAHTRLFLSEGNRKVTLMNRDQSYSSHPDRFTYYRQVLSRETLTGCCYWEVEWTGGVFIAVTYRGGGDDCGFGFDDRSWALDCEQKSCNLYCNKIRTVLSVPVSSSRVGVFLDHREGLLSFYSVSDTMTLLHRVYAAFTQPLHAGVGLYWSHTEVTAEFCQLK